MKSSNMIFKVFKLIQSDHPLIFKKDLLIWGNNADFLALNTPSLLFKC